MKGVSFIYLCIHCKLFIFIEVDKKLSVLDRTTYNICKVFFNKEKRQSYIKRILWIMKIFITNCSRNLCNCSRITVTWVRLKVVIPNIYLQKNYTFISLHVTSVIMTAQFLQLKLLPCTLSTFKPWNWFSVTINFLAFSQLNTEH